MKKFVALALALVAVLALASNAQAFGRRGHRCQSCQPAFQPCQPATTFQSCQPVPSAGVTYYPQYAPAQVQPATVTTVAPATNSNCANGTCTPSHGFGFFRRR